MSSLENTLRGIVTAIVTKPDAVSIEEEVSGNTVTLTVNVDPDDMGKVIGRHGRIAKSIRMLMRAAAGQENKKVNVDIR